MTLSYETAKRLKEAGFPQVFVQNNPKGSTAIETFGPYIPTLEELIEACGDRFLSVMHLVGTDDHQNYWIATDRENIGSHKCQGSTPSEAVAELYLKLNKQ